MPVGKIRFFDTEKGFGFISGADGKEVYVHASILGEGQELAAGVKVEYSVADGRKGPQALSLSVLEPVATVHKKRKKADEMAVIVEDLVKLLDLVGEDLKRGKHPERAKARKVAQMLRHVAGELDV
ncbi:cold shock domain-containing protein [Canibacter sp. lx-72]|uniref:cold-shock protein n=1 Tax=Canibacter zhuwentaonis TaxID=2837491 RepID=UPI001BDCF876|nr:cold shock domain-containing protein [Canibacter zhuwentaonis]MBT1018608.1 cold shock domain-containing protein [Canibacter zhuwentaonis]